jgi:ElaA protein
MSIDITWSLRPWASLTAAELHALLQLRSRVFVVEQACVFLEIDGRDPDALHLLGTVKAPLPEPAGGVGVHGAGGDGPSAEAMRAGDAYLAAYARLFAPDTRYAGASCIGRVVTHPSARGSGAGRAVMREAIAACESRWPGVPIGLEAQQHLEPFYASLGFRTSGAQYMEDGIPHVPMRRSSG